MAWVFDVDVACLVAISAVTVSICPGSTKFAYCTFFASFSITVLWAKLFADADQPGGRLGHGFQHQHAGHDGKTGKMVRQVFFGQRQALDGVMLTPGSRSRTRSTNVKRMATGDDLVGLVVMETVSISGDIQGHNR